MDESGDFITQHGADQHLKCDKTGLVSSNGNGDAISASQNSPSHRTGSRTYRISPSGPDILKSSIQPASLNSGIFGQKCAKRPEALRVASIRQELRSDFQLQEQLRTEGILKNSAAFGWPHQSHRNETLLNGQSVSAASLIRSSVDHFSNRTDNCDHFSTKKEENVLGFGNCRGSRNLEKVHMSHSTTKQADGFPRLDVLAEPSMYLQQEQPQQLNSSCRNSLPPSLSASFEMHQTRLKKGVAHKHPSKLPNIAETAVQRTPNIAEHFRLNGAVENNFLLKLPVIQGATKYNAEKTLDVQEGIGNQGHLQGSRKKRRNPPKASCKAVTLKKRFDESDDLTSTGYPSGCSSRNSSVHDDDSSS